MPNVNYTIRALKKNDLSAKNLKSGELEPILEGLYKLREYNHRASREAKERLEIATRSLLAVTELLYSLDHRRQYPGGGSDTEVVITVPNTRS